MIFPLVAAAAIRYVPATIRSGINVYVLSFSSSTPSIWIQSVPSPEILAPFSCRKWQSSTTSGSFAQFFILVIPGAYTAARTAFSVAPTLGNLRRISLPCHFCADARSIPSCSSKTAPIPCIAAIWMSIGRIPMMQPPGNGSSAFLFLPRSAPRSRIVERICLPSDGSTRNLSASFASMISVLFLFSITQPRSFMI